VIDVQTPLPHHFLQVVVPERIPKLPPDTQEHDFCLKMTPFEGIRLVHEGNSLRLLDEKQSLP